MPQLVSIKTGSEKLKRPRVVLLLSIVLILAALLLTHYGLPAAAILIALPLVLGFLLWLFFHPRNGIVVYLFAAFLTGALGRYIPGIPFGLSLDTMLFLTLLAFIFTHFYSGISWKAANHPLTWITGAWFFYTILQMFNPESQSTVAWFYAMRGVALYPFFTVLLSFLLFSKKKDLHVFLKIWAVFTLLSALKGIQQVYIGVDPFEQRWLNEGAANTHILFGNLRAFGLYSDAGTYGAAMAQGALVFFAAGLDTKRRKTQVFYFITAALAILGTIISGTRGALVIPAFGGLLYLLLRKNIRLFSVGAFAMLAFFLFLKFTTIGNSFYEINRMRSALNPDDASLQVRLQNQRKLATYLRDKPFGGGVGSAGYWGLRFSPNTLLAQTPTDSWYVRIWAEMGIVGLGLHMAMLIYFLIAGSRIVFVKIHNRELNGIMAGFMGGYFGVMVASYGNQILGQLPIGQTLFISLTLVFISPKIQNEMQQNDRSGKSSYNHDREIQ
ncbi:MAG: O-antigen ligase family protein [Bacteroidales bacterium]